jgi:hypothetical protein
MKATPLVDKEIVIYSMRCFSLRDTSYAVAHFNLVLPAAAWYFLFFVIGFRARSAKTNNDRKKTHRSAGGDDRIRYATA